MRKLLRLLATPARWRQYAREASLRSLGMLARLPIVGDVFGRILAQALGPYKARGKWVRLTGKSYLSPSARIWGSGLKIGGRCFLDDDVTVFIRDADCTVVLHERVAIWRGTIMELQKGGRIVIGARTAIQPYCIINSIIGPIEIGSGVQIAAHCSFFSYRHVFSDSTLPIMEQGLESKGGIVIEDDAWIGSGVRVMDGVRIGRGSVIGAGSVVTRDVPANSVAVGAPARVVASRT